MEKELVRALAERNLRIGELRIWLWLYSEQTGRKRIFHEQIAKSLQLHRSTIAQAISRLRTDGLLEGCEGLREPGKVMRPIVDPRLWKPDERQARKHDYPRTAEESAP